MGNSKGEALLISEISEEEESLTGSNMLIDKDQRNKFRRSTYRKKSQLKKQ